jgi:prefoldin subunit 5
MKKVFYLGKSWENADRRLRAKITCINFSIMLLNAAIERVEQKRKELRTNFTKTSKRGRRDTN